MSSKISWTDETWNVVTGCSKISAGCKNCYAERISNRFGWTDKSWNAENIEKNVKWHLDRLKKPYQWTQSKRCFVNSMSDLFHEYVPGQIIDLIFAVMINLPQHRFQILTKRSKIMQQYANTLLRSSKIVNTAMAKMPDDVPWQPELATPFPPENVWFGVSVENKKTVYRLDVLRQTRARFRFVSFEPLLEDLGKLDLSEIDLVIVGGESGGNYRSMDHAWARSIRDQCDEQDVEFHFKQSAGLRPGMGAALQEIDGSTSVYQEYPEAQNAF